MQTQLKPLKSWRLRLVLTYFGNRFNSMPKKPRGSTPKPGGSFVPCRAVGGRSCGAGAAGGGARAHRLDGAGGRPGAAAAASWWVPYLTTNRRFSIPFFCLEGGALPRISGQPQSFMNLLLPLPFVTVGPRTAPISPGCSPDTPGVAGLALADAAVRGAPGAPLGSQRPAVEARAARTSWLAETNGNPVGCVLWVGDPQ